MRHTAYRGEHYPGEEHPEREGHPRWELAEFWTARLWVVGKKGIAEDAHAGQAEQGSDSDDYLHPSGDIRHILRISAIAHEDVPAVHDDAVVDARDNV